MDSEIWADGSGKKVPWNYLVVINAGNDESRLNIFRYSSAKPSGLPAIESNSEWAKTFTPGLTALLESSKPKDSKRAADTSAGRDDKEKDKGDDKDKDTKQTPDGQNTDGKEKLAEYVKQMIDFAKEKIPDVQIARTPLFLHATGSIKDLSNADRHALLRSTCDYIKSHSDFLLNSCKKQVYDIDAEAEALLGWISANYKSAGQLAIDSEGIVELTPYGIQAAYIPTKGSKSKLDRISLGNGNSTNYFFDLNTFTSPLGYEELWQRYKDEYMQDGKTVNCVPLGYELGKGTAGGDYAKCLSDISALSGDLKPLADPASSFQLVGHFSELLEDHFANREEDIQKFCQTPWQKILETDQFKPLETAALAKLCFKATYAYHLHNSTLFDGADGIETQISAKFNGLPYTWSYGRALIFATDEVSGSKTPSGIQANIGAVTYKFGVTDETKRPKLAAGDAVARLDRLSHRLYGGLIFMLVLLAFLLFLLGHKRRSHIWQTIGFRGRGRSGYKNLRPEEFELDEIDELEIDNENEHELGHDADPRSGRR